jgi:glycosyltransferase involved in cell wall biosynthesis
MKPVDIAIVVYGLSENWLGGVNYYRNLLTVFDGAAHAGMRLNVFTNNPGFFDDMRFSPRVLVHRVAMLEHRTPEWFLRKVVHRTTGRDLMLLRLLRRAGVQAIVFSHVPGAKSFGLRCLPWIPDFQSQRHPELFPDEVVSMERQRALDWVRDADGLIVSSMAARNDAVQLFGADPERLHVMRFAPRLDTDAIAQPAMRDTVLAKHGIDRPYFFLPNQYWQHKNHALVVAALRLIQAAGGPVPLVVSTGKTDDFRKPEHFPEFQASVQAAGLQQDYRILGVIDRHDMLVLLANATAVINPSRFEGWSTSVEEAKALGKPLLASDIAVHREQVKGLANADLFGPDDAVALAALMQKHAARTGDVRGSPSQPNPDIYRRFEQQFMALLQEAVGSLKEPS